MPFDPKLKMVRVADPRRQYDNRPPAAAIPSARSGGLWDDVQRGAGQMVGSAGAALEDFGPTAGIGHAMEDWGGDLAARHPSAINSISDLVRHPGTAAREAIGENVPQIAAIIAAGEGGRIAGGAIGGGLGALVAAPTAEAASVVTVPIGVEAGQEIGGRLFGAIPTYLQEYGSIRQAQRETGKDNQGAAILGGLGATALEFLFGPEAAAGAAAARAVKRSGTNLLTRVVRDAAGEGVTEVLQTGVERASAGQNLTDRDAINDYVISGFKGAAAGGTLGPIGHALRPGRAEVNPDPHGQTDILSPRPTLRLTDQRMPDHYGGQDRDPITGGDFRSGVADGLNFRAPTTYDQGSLRVENHNLASGEQGSLFASRDMGPPASDAAAPVAAEPPVAPPAEPVDHTRIAPADPEPDMFDVEHGMSKVLLRLRAANRDADGFPGKADAFTLKLANTVSENLNSRDPAAALTHIDKIGEALKTADAGSTVEKRLNALDEARTIVDDYKKRAVAAAADAVQTPAAAPRPAEAVTRPGAQGYVAPEVPAAATTPLIDTPVDTTVAQAREQNDAMAAQEQTAQAKAQFESDLSVANEHIDSSFQRQQDEFRHAEAMNRRDTLQKVLDDPTTRNPVGRFIATLRAQGHTDLSVKPEEAATISRFESVRDAAPGTRSDALAATAPPAAAPSAEVVTGQLNADEFTRPEDVPAETPPAVEAIQPDPVEAPVSPPADTPAAPEVKPTPRAKLKLPKDRVQPPPAVAEEEAATAPEAGSTEAVRAEAAPRAVKMTPDQLTEKLVKLHANELIDQPTLNQLNTLVQQGNVPLEDINQMANDAAKGVEPETKPHTAVLEQVSEVFKMGLIDAKTRQSLIAQAKTLTPEQLTNALHDEVTNAKLPQKLDATRRGFLAGAGALGVAAATAPMVHAATPIAGEQGFRAVMKAGDANAALKWFATNSKNPAYRSLAAKLAAGGLGKTKITIAAPGSIDYQEVQGEGARADTDTATGMIRLTDSNDPDTTGMREETALHEMVHAWVAARYRRLSLSNDHNRTAVKMPAQAGTAAVDNWTALWKATSKQIADTISKEGDMPTWAQEFYRSPDEALTWTFTDPEAQAWLKTHTMSGSKTDGPSIWDHIVNWVRDLIGLPKTASNDMLSHLMEAGHRIFREGSADAPSFDYSDRITAKFDAMDKPAQRIAAARQAPAAQIGKLIEDTKLNTGYSARGIGLKLMTLWQLVERYGQRLPSFRGWYDGLMQSSARTSQYTKAAADLRTEWNKLKTPGETKAIGELLLDATHFQIDPRVVLSPTNGSGNETRYNELRDKHEALTPAGKTVFNDVLRAGSDTQDKKKALFIKLIRETMADPAAQASAIRDAEQMFRQNRIYFPLSRFGRHLVVGRKPAYAEAEQDHRAAVEALKALPEDASGEDNANARTAVVATRKAMTEAKDAGYIVTASETPSEQAAWVKQLESEGYNTKALLREEFVNSVDGSSHTFVNSLIQAMSAFDADPSVVKGMQALVREMALTSLPDHSALKRNIPRKNIAGFDTDAQRAFASAAIRDAHFLARLEFGQQSRTALARMRDEAVAGNSNDQQLYDVIKKHHAAMLQYVETPVQDKIGNIGFLWFLGLTPAFGVINMLQTPMISMPMIAATHGLPRTIGALTKAMTDVAAVQLGTFKDGGWQADTAIEKFTKDPGEQAMLRHLLDRSRIDTSQAHDLATTAAGDDPRWLTMMKVASFVPHHTEVVNRVATALASYRLAKIAGHANPTAYAEKMVADSHFDYSRENAPYLFKAMPWAKVLLQFKKYQQAMGYVLIENARLSLPEAFNKDATPEQRSVARRTLFGLVATHALMAGSLGLPGAGAAMFALDMLMKLFTDDDDPWDSQTEWRKFLASVFGREGGEIAAKGLPITLGVDISQRVGQADVFNPIRTRGMNTEGRDAFAQYVAAATGPAGSIAGDMFEASKQFHQGNVARGWELMMPKVVRDVLRSHRFADEGITTEGGNTLVPPSDVTALDKTLQLLGFMPAHLSEHYDQQSSELDRQTSIGDARKLLLKRFAEAKVAGDAATIAAVRADVDSFNANRAKDSDGKPITLAALLKAAQARAAYGKKVVRGVHVTTPGGASEGDYAVTFGEDGDPDAAPE